MAPPATGTFSADDRGDYYHNTLDADAPTSRVNLRGPTAQTGDLEIHWGGQDPAGGSGIASFDVFMTLDGGPAQLIFDDTTDSAGVVPVTVGHSYAFWSVATDNVGHVEAGPVSP
jgi:hypothetical protein